MSVPPSEITFRTAADGTRLAVRSWPTSPATPRGTVLLVHGLGEHSGRYEHVAAALVEWGWRVVAYDHRGHGASEGARGALRDAEDLTRDLIMIGEEARAASRGAFVLFGHSMGGLLVAEVVADGRCLPDALVMTSPALDAGLSWPQRLQLAIARALVPDLAIGNGLDAAYLSHDPTVEPAYRADPLVHNRVTARLVRSLVDGGARVLSAAADWQVPTLLMWAGADRLVAPAGSAVFAACASAALVRSHRFDDLYHEILNESGAAREQVFLMLRRWLDERVPA